MENMCKERYGDLPKDVAPQKKRLLREINELMYEYGDDEVCIELQGDDCINIALCCDENECYTTTLKC